MIASIFKKLCPNCGGDITSERLYKGLTCDKCLPEEPKEDVCDVLKKGKFKILCDIDDEVSNWQNFFSKRIGSHPWSLQITWAKRFFLNRSFALLAPTGIGKTSFGLSVASYLAQKNKKSYIILPTKLLVNQTVKKLTQIFKLKEDQILFFGEENKKEKETKLERLKDGDFSVLITTSMFLYKNHDKIPKDFSLVFVDDVDSFLKTAKNIDKALYLLGFDEKDINLALEVIKLKAKQNKTDEDWNKINQLTEKLRKIEAKRKGVLIVSSATSNPKSNRIKLFRELLGFEVGTPTFYLRNIVDSYDDIENHELSELIKKLGKGGLVFIPSDKKKEYAEEVKEYLTKKGVKAATYEEIDDEILEKYENGKIDVLIGISSYRNPLARGIDLPHVIRYAIFYGVPKIVLSLKFEANLSHLLWALSSIRAYILKKFPQHAIQIDKWITQLKKYQYLTEEFLQNNPNLKEKVDNLRLEVGQFLNSEEIINLLKESNEVTLRKDEDGYKLVVSDVTGYLQASGRTSRMYSGGITKGLSVILIDDKKAFNHLQKRVKWFSDDIEFVDFKSIELDKILKEIDSDREKVRKILKGEIKFEKVESILKPVLIVVESPNKARTIANFFGKAVRRRVNDHEILETSIDDRYLMITASLGHILDLNKELGYYGVFVKDHIEPVYETIEGKEEIIESIRSVSFESLEVYVATDPDTEGEKIGWDVELLLKPYVKNIQRMEFHEVTKKAIINAIKNPRDFDENLVKAQIVRRVADRWVGFEYSQLLQKAFGKNWLSAGRVQTPVLGWIIEREKERRQKIYGITITLQQNSRKLELDIDYQNKQDAENIFNNLNNIEIIVKEVKEEDKNPLPPYRTDTMLKDASDRYRFSLPKTMKLAQDLFELGYITYHRTDSTRVSDVGIALAREYIEEAFGKDYFQARVWGEGGAHECIRPTRAMETEELKSMILSGQYEGLTFDHIKLYDLIFKRFIASQMRAVKFKVKDVIIKGFGFELEKVLHTDIIQDGWNKILPAELHPDLEGIIDISNNKQFKIMPKAFPFTHGELVFRMKERGIGRPSTYATIIAKLLERKYVIEKKGLLFPTSMGIKVYQYLNSLNHVREFLSEEFTRKLEELMDKVEIGEKDYEAILFELLEKIKIKHDN
ncbi:reverse gyrase [Sulfurihydrogenibium sp.]|jgi:reverse gyrase|uniref:reverse gyrase n=1 Tax=Sulfurihydrogenibium sp. TaxID=2053621 RepID=UPI00261AB1C0|nr:reverse gyrase [Sulfurihydrogenibium sp.]